MKKLAINGGEPLIKTPPQTHFPWPIITDATKAAVIKQIDESVSIYNRSGIFEDFENKFAKSIGKKFALVTSSGTSALHSLYVGIGLKPGDEVLCPAYTFYATVTPILQTGAIPILCDAINENGNIDPIELEKKLTEKTKAVMVTHMWGRACNMVSIKNFCSKHNLKLLEDCSHAHGGYFQNKPLGSWGSAAAWSLQGQKIITGGEGGILVTDDEEIYYRALLLGHYNKRCTQEIPKDHPYSKYSVTGMGLKLRAHPLAIAIANEQLSQLSKWHQQKSIFANYLSERMSKYSEVSVPQLQEGEDPAWYAYIIRFNEKELGDIPVEKMYQAIKAEGCVDADMPGSTCPLNLLPLFQNPGELFPQYQGVFSYKPGFFPVAEKFFTTAIKIPVWVNSEDRTLVEMYADAIEKVILNKHELL